MPSLRNVHNRLAALEARLPTLGVEDDPSTPAQGIELTRRLAALQAATGDDLTPVLERNALARSTADKEAAIRSCTIRELQLLLVLRGEALDDDGQYTRGSFTDEERAAIAAACAGWGQLEHGKE